MPAETLACLSPFSPAAVVAQLSLWAVVVCLKSRSDRAGATPSDVNYSRPLPASAVSDSSTDASVDATGIRASLRLS